MVGNTITRQEGTRNVRVSEAFRGTYPENHPMTLMIGTIIEVHSKESHMHKETDTWISYVDSETLPGHDTWMWEEDWLEFL